MAAAIDMTGHRYGRLTVQHLSPSSKPGDRRWMCACDCGARLVAIGKNLRTGNTRSCGCLQRELAAAKVVERCTTHGMYRSPEFNVWTNMIQRCTNPNHKSFKDYGGRGIAVCRRWLNSFEAFFNDMGPRPFPHAQIDREKNDRDYEPGNCRWVEAEVNANNRRVSRHITFAGKTLSIAQWSREVGCSRQALRHRLNSGWSVQDALTLPMDHANKVERNAA